MGLDNIPANYPCKTADTAVWIDDDDDSPRIDCQATIEAGGCPWASDPDRPTNGHVVGMFGTSCWYRGKYGNALIEQYGTYDESEGLSFYGSNAAADFKTPDECRTLAEHLDDVIGDTDTENGWYQSEDRDYLAYAAWWLRFAADKCGGTIAWY